jgi:hypothetical protein
MKKLISVLALLLVFAMCFTACQKNPDTPNNSPSNSGENTSAPNSTSEPTVEPTTEPNWREKYPQEDIKLIEKFFEIWNSEDKDFSNVLMYREADGSIPDPEHLKAGGWAIADIPNFKYATNIEFIEIAGEYTDKTSNAWERYTVVREKDAHGTVTPIYLDPDSTSIYLIKLNVKVDEELYDDFLEEFEEPSALMPDVAYTFIVLTTIDNSRLVFSLPGADYTAVESMGFDIPDDEMQRWLDREAQIQKDWD